MKRFAIISRASREEYGRYNAVHEAKREAQVIVALGIIEHAMVVDMETGEILFEER